MQELHLIFLPQASVLLDENGVKDIIFIENMIIITKKCKILHILKRKEYQQKELVVLTNGNHQQVKYPSRETDGTVNMKWLAVIQ